MRLYTIGFTQKSAKEFFDKIKNNNIELLLDIRLNNISQLAGFAKGIDLEFFLSEICNCKYEHILSFAPTKEILDDYRAKKISWDKYEKLFNKILIERKIENDFKKYLNIENVCLLCSEPTPEQCHRKLVAQYLQSKLPNIEIIHI